MKFRKLKAEEIEARIGTFKDTGLSLLLYKDARVDQNILDETVGVFNWQRDHKELKGNIYCGVGIWDENKNQWIWKWDAGAESNTEAVKGEASDSFKRACFNLGIGRELYTSPFIWISKGLFKSKYDKFEVLEIGYNEKSEVNKLKIKNNTLNKIVFEMGKSQPKVETKVLATRDEIDLIKQLVEENKIPAMLAYYKVESIEDLTQEQAKEIIERKQNETKKV